MSSNEASKQAKVSSHVPNKRERAASQFGQVDVTTAADWDSLPTSIKDALDQLAARVKALETP
jgi:hypothetical protein